MKDINTLLENRIFYYFDKLTKIPRCSFEEEKIREYLIGFAKEHNLEYKTDKIGNVVIIKEATKGYEDVDSIILQGHMDMVCEKTPECIIDFSKDAIKYEIEGDFIVAHDTTLGADNGIAIAMILALLESKEYKHPKIEALFTVNEESGMTGAANLEGGMVTSKRLLNLDSETEGVGCISCAGAERDLIKFKKEFKKLDKEKTLYEVIVNGLKGGHSGQEIQVGLGNAVKILGRSLYRIFEQVSGDLIEIEGGAKPNAIPRYAKAIVAVKEEDIKKIQDIIVELNSQFVTELGKVDPDVRLNFERTKVNLEKAFTDELKNKIIGLLNILPNGVIAMSKNIHGLVETSVNVGVIEDKEESINIISNIRSSVQSSKEYIGLVNKIAANSFGAEIEIMTKYPAWEYKENSPLREVAKKAYKEVSGKEFKLEAIHAGLECGMFVETIGDIDMLSIGPNMKGVHAPGEHLSISSTERVFDFLIRILEELK
ncbi:aminoacyl-histidine dipeptidase [Peptoniphilus sp. AGMB00490]|uniref:Cytosol non-specific dipeptidase n=1 Tax=Peptoniphilus faecalis TaxID=2731255 RepID=A0A848RKJ9_9FIRM|nr:aminoacyl-histidine dipeptidase [Peptoniphilus faecalis]NMW84654.1 aminoacyl-histidine dipeptidase [Peptoniphilus faecalis]